MNTELVYADGYATQLKPLSPVKENKSSQARKTLSTAWLIVTVLLVRIFILL